MTIRTAAKRAHSGTHGNNRNKDLSGGNLVKLQRVWDISEDGKRFVLKCVPLDEVYVKSGLQEKSDIYLYGRAKSCHRGYSKAAWNMCCKNRKKHGICGSDADVERKLARAQLSECTFTKSTRDDNTNKEVKNVNKKRKDSKPQGQGATLCALFK